MVRINNNLVQFDSFYFILSYILRLVRFMALRATSIKIMILWVVTPCSLVCISQTTHKTVILIVRLVE
jgi:hypothetical protein